MAGRRTGVTSSAEGESLRLRLGRDHTLGLEETLRVASDIATALDRMHARGVVHRGVRPETITLSALGARLSEPDAAPTMSPAYASPEQAGGRQDLEARSDQYALACVVYEMLAGEPPFSGATPDRVLYQHLVTRPRPVAERRAGVPPDVSAALSRALAKAPTERFASCGAFVNELIDSARGTGMLEPKRRVSTAALVAIPFVALLLVLVAGWVGRGCKAG